GPRSWRRSLRRWSLSHLCIKSFRLTIDDLRLTIEKPIEGNRNHHSAPHAYRRLFNRESSIVNRKLIRGGSMKRVSKLRPAALFLLAGLAVAGSFSRAGHRNAYP